MNRKVAREIAYQLVFEYMFNGDSQVTRDIIYETSPDMDENSKAYIDKVLVVVDEHFDELKEFISHYTTNFDIDRLFKADLAVLLLAVAEIKYFDDIPVGVSIDEAVELSKKYSVENGYKFVNGVLGAISRDL